MYGHNRQGGCVFVKEVQWDQPAKIQWGQDMIKTLIEPLAKVSKPVPNLCDEDFSKKI